MMEDEPDLSIMSRHSDPLIDSFIAAQIARLLHTKYYGAADLEANEPLTVSEQGDYWIVLGAKKVRIIEANKSMPLDGPLQVRISKLDGQIMSYTVAIRFADLRT